MHLRGTLKRNPRSIDRPDPYVVWSIILQEKPRKHSVSGASMS